MAGWLIMPVLRTTIVVCALLGGCSSGTANPSASAPASSVATTATTVVTTSTEAPSTTFSATSTTVPQPLVYVYPFVGTKTSYGHRHHDYPATDVFGCGADVVAPIRGTIEETRVVDPWVQKVDDPATRGGKYVAMLGDDNVRYYFAHLGTVAVQPGEVVDAGQQLGVMGQTGNARKSACHTHFGISWPCPAVEWAVRRGEIWPWKYLDAWRDGEQLSPVDEITWAEAANPDACNLAALAPGAADA